MYLYIHISYLLVVLISFLFSFHLSFGQFSTTLKLISILIYSFLI